MRVCFILPTLRPSGGAAVASEYARGLAREHGVDAELVVVEGAAERWPDLGVPVRTPAEAAEGGYDVAIATWWETAAYLWQIAATRRMLLLQGFEQRFYDRDAPFERMLAEATLALAVDFVAVAPWLRDMLVELRPSARCTVARPAVDKALFSGERRPRREPLEVLIEGQPTLPIKGVQQAVEAVGAMREPVRSTLVALDPTVAGDLPVDRVVGGLDAEGMAALYGESDVLLKLSRVEGLGLAPVEAFHSGVPCVVTPFTGHSEYASHGRNALVVPFDDVRATADALDALARDDTLLAELSAGALATAAEWPDQREGAQTLYDALTGTLDADPPVADEALLRRTLELNGELGRARLRRSGAATEDALTRAERLVRELSASRDECGERLERARAELARIRSSLPYRVGRAAKRMWRAPGAR